MQRQLSCKLLLPILYRISRFNRCRSGKLSFVFSKYKVLLPSCASEPRLPWAASPETRQTQGSCPAPLLPQCPSHLGRWLPQEALLEILISRHMYYVNTCCKNFSDPRTNANQQRKAVTLPDSRRYDAMAKNRRVLYI